MLLILTILCAAALYIAQAQIYKRLWNKHLDVFISYDKEYCVEGEENTLIEVITNRKFLPIPVLHVKFNTPKTFLFSHEDNTSVTDYYYRDDIFSIMGNQVITRKLNFICSKRGCYYMHDTSLVANDLFLQSTFNSSISNPNILHVYPGKIDITPFDIPFNTITGNYATQKTLIEDPFEFKGIRDYEHYDTMRSINWKSSARTGKLQVNTYFMTSSQEVVILLNLDTNVYTKNERLIETTIRIASSLCLNFIKQNIPVRLETNGIDIFTKERIFQKSGQGMAHMSAIDNALSRIDTNLENADYLTVVRNIFKNPNRNTYYIFISNNRHEDLINYYHEIKNRQFNSYFIVPEYGMSQVTEQIQDMIKWNID